MKLNKISLIEPPHPEVVLGIGEMNNILGGDTCLTYTICIGNLNFEDCASHRIGKKDFCTGNKDAKHMLCTLYTVFCDSHDNKNSCTSYSKNPCLTFH